MPTTPVDVDTDTYLSAGALFLEVNGAGARERVDHGRDVETWCNVQQSRTGRDVDDQDLREKAGGLDADQLRQSVRSALTALES